MPDDTEFRYWFATFKTPDVFSQQRIQVIAPNSEIGWEKITNRLSAEFGTADVFLFQEVHDARPHLMPPEDKSLWEQRQYAIADERRLKQKQEVQERAKKAREHRQGIHNAAEMAHRQLREEQRQRKLENAIY